MRIQGAYCLQSRGEKSLLFAHVRCCLKVEKAEETFDRGEIGSNKGCFETF